MKVIFVLQGLYLPLLRLSEPVFIYVLKENLKAIFWPCNRQKRESVKIDVASLIDRDVDVVTIWDESSVNKSQLKRANSNLRASDPNFDLGMRSSSVIIDPNDVKEK